MSLRFSSSELNSLLQNELAEGGYELAENALLAGLQVLRENRELKAQMADRLASLRDGRAIEVEGDEALGAFLDSIDAEMTDSSEGT